MKKQGDEIIYSPSDLIVYMESSFASWMDRYHLELPGTVTPDEDDASQELLQKMGNEHEAHYLKFLQNDGRQVFEVPRDGDRFATTIEAMQDGNEIIYQGALRDGGFMGYADFLVKVQGQSKLGSYHYEPWDTKLALKAKPYFIIQLGCYAEMLEAVQGCRPQSLHVVLGNREQISFRTEDYVYFYRQLKQSFIEWQESFNHEKQPIPDGMSEHSRWKSHAEKILEDIDHLSRVANIRSVAIAKLEKSGISKMKDLAETACTHVEKMLPSTLSTLKQQARLQIESVGLKIPKHEVIKPDPDNPRRGLALLPPASPLDVFFDMEGYPHIEGGLEYLFGVSYKEGNKLKFKDWWAHDRIAERIAFEQFIDWSYARWKQDPSMHIYHYAPYEVTAARKLMGRYGTREIEVDSLLRNEVFVDLYKIVHQGLRVGEPKYSIKNIEHLYKDKREGDVATAIDSIVGYQSWLENPDGTDWTTSKILGDIRSYNKEDCDSTVMLADWLRGVARKEGINWIPKFAIDEEPDPDKDRSTESSLLADKLLSSLPNVQEQPDKYRLQELLAYLLEFHRRAEKPVWWAMFDRAAMTDEQLRDDIDCLAELERTSRPVEPIKRSQLFEYKFDPNQDTKLHMGSKVYLTHDLSKAEIAEFDSDHGFIGLKIGSQKPTPPNRINIIPDELVTAKDIAKSILRTVSQWSETGKLPQAIEDFLLRRRPDINGNSSGPIIPAGVDLETGAMQAVTNMQDTTLCIQGPPGSGKTTSAAKLIAELLKRGKKVGIASNSHKAILNLMEHVMKVSPDAAANAVKIGGDDSIDGVTHIASASKVFNAGVSNFQLHGGTAWAFSHEQAIGALDYLFVDEAGQVSIANLLGMAPSTRNIVLTGDQMQLDQPIKGSHPGDSGKSTLEYLLQDHQTIPEDFGIFLGTSHRMHPHVCEFISSSFYDDRLHAEPKTANRVVIPPDGGKLITKNSGILYVSVPHDGNTQGSDEEVEKIQQIVAELLKCQLTTDDGKTKQPLTLKDIKIVAPYNLQVRHISQAIPGVEVGSVDKFQGQQARVIIVSMCASSADASPRGMEFLLSKNRLNVAISRAQSLAIVVASPALARANCSQVEQMQLVNLFCKIVESGSSKASAVNPNVGSAS